MPGSSTTTTATEPEAIPCEFLCPLTLQPFDYPLMSRWGTNYERSAILEWLDRGNDSCPLTRKPLTLSGLVHNRVLKTQIQEWKAENGYGDEDDECRLSQAGLCVRKDIPIKVNKPIPGTAHTASDCSNAAAEQSSSSTPSRRGKHWLWGGKKKRGGEPCWC